MTATGTASEVLRLLIVDDQPLIRRGLAMMLAAEPDIEVVGQAADGLEAIEYALDKRPDVVVMDLQMPRASGIVATREITAKLPATKVVVLTTYDYDELVFEAICAGAQAYLLKDASEARYWRPYGRCGAVNRACHRPSLVKSWINFAPLPDSRLSQPPALRKVLELSQP
jgi:DNA-binding NarL/FixJ family response regulator